MRALCRYRDPNPGFGLCVSAQNDFEHHHMNTKVLPAGFTSTDDVMELAGIHHVTLPAYLLEQLESLPASTTKPKSLFEEDSHEIPLVSAMYLYHKETFMKAIERGYYGLSQVNSMCYIKYVLIDL